VIIAAAVIPQPPALLPGLTGGRITEVEELRTAAVNALAWTIAQEPDLIIALADDGVSRIWPDETPIDRSGYLGTATRTPVLPLGLSVLRSLLPATAGARLQTVAADLETIAATAAEIAAAAPRVALVVAADGSARRGLKAPGYIDARAIDHDAHLAQCLRTGDAAGLAALDRHLAAELLSRGATSLRVLGTAVGEQVIEAELDYAADPFGVFYAVARWRVSPARR
jgi:hypothetical protein